MAEPRALRARQIEVPAEEPLLGDGAYDYADTFEIDLLDDDPRTAEEFARVSLEEAPAVIRSLVWNVHRHALRFRLGSRTAPDRILGWRIVVSEPDVFQMEASGPLVRATIIGRRVERSRSQVTTYVFYVRPAIARAFELLVGPVHRRVAKLLLERAAAAPLARAHTAGR